MIKTVKDLISPLRGIAKELNKESDSITHMLREFEDGLNKLNIGLTIWDAVDVTRKDGENFSIGYSKLYGRWTLTCKRGYVCSRLLDENRDIRTAALPYLPELTKKLRSKIDHTLKSIEEVKACDK